MSDDNEDLPPNKPGYIPRNFKDDEEDTMITRMNNFYRRKFERYNKKNPDKKICCWGCVLDKHSEMFSWWKNLVLINDNSFSTSIIALYLWEFLVYPDNDERGCLTIFCTVKSLYKRYHENENIFNDTIFQLPKCFDDVSTDNSINFTTLYLLYSSFFYEENDDLKDWELLHYLNVNADALNKNGQSPLIFAISYHLNEYVVTDFVKEMTPSLEMIDPLTNKSVWELCNEKYPDSELLKYILERCRQ